MEDLAQRFVLGEVTSGVLVPWALTWWMSPGSRRASRRAVRIAWAASRPSGSGAVGLWASQEAPYPARNGPGRGAAGPGVFGAFQDEHGGGLTEHEPVAVGVEGPAGVLWLSGAAGEGAHPVEADRPRA
ncbi:hypothetical protein GCM10010446_44440 [Streptomyces enissocaesilis]|uniref:Uncharacterized protein n=1 Tax=Streptomyces enissocaesilis TaxID=332589 RepID=A0ABN3XJB4_9ACTN